MKTIAVTALSAMAMAATTATAVSAQVLNLSCQFQCVKVCAAGPQALAYITQTDWQLNLVNEAGIPSRAWIDYPGHFWAQNWNEGAIYSPDGTIIQFDRGTVWQRVVEVPPPPPSPPRLYKVHKHHHAPLAPR